MTKSNFLSELQWQRWLGKAIEAAARAWAAGKPMPDSASEMFHDFDEAWDHLVRGNVERAAKLTAPYGYPIGAIRNQAKLLADDVQNGFKPRKGSEFMEALIMDYYDEFQQREELSRKETAATKEKTSQIKELIGHSAIYGPIPRSDSNTVVSVLRQPSQADVLDPDLTPEQLAPLMTWVERNYGKRGDLYYEPEQRFLAFVMKSPRTARRTGWDRD